MARVAGWLKRLWERPEPRCLGCGDCCRQFGWHLRASEGDLQRWRELGREDLLERVNRLGWIWVDPDTKQPLPECPFLVEKAPDKVRCAIHEIKPDMCRTYPTLDQYRTCVHGAYVG